jgi:starch-binding outer membrane protein, SusD/RagB family
MKSNRKYLVTLLSALMLTTMGCNEDFLNPEPLSFFSPENSLVNKQGMESLLTACEEIFRADYSRPWVRVEYIFSDIAIPVSTDLIDLNANVYPESEALFGGWYNIGNYWEGWYNTIKYANMIISRIDDATEATEEEKNALLGKAYFYRARAYYRLTHQFGDVPLILDEVQSPRLDFYTYTRESILEKMKADLDQFAQYIPDVAPHGTANKDAAYHLLTKVNLALGEFDAAITSASVVIDGGTHELMTERFGEYKKQEKLTEGFRAYANGGEVDLDIIWDLHRHENITDRNNKEVLFAVIDRLNIEGNDDANVPDWNILYRSGQRNMRNCTPSWSRAGVINTPSGVPGMEAYDDDLNMYRTIGRGEGYIRGCDHMNYGMWDDPDDLRHKQPNWWRMTDIVYNASALKNTADSIYYGAHLTMSDRPAGTDSIRCWAPFFNKFLNEDDRAVANGSNQDWYVYRVAETYLLRAEAYFWKDELQMAANDINEVRERANCGPLAAGDVDIESILDERAKELYMEEPRKCELTRMSYLFAETGKDYDGKTYTVDNLSESSFFYDRIMKINNFYRDEIPEFTASHTISAYHILWPIPADAIIANTLGHINQNDGYVGSEKNIEPKVYPADYPLD